MLHIVNSYYYEFTYLFIITVFLFTIVFNWKNIYLFKQICWNFGPYQILGIIHILMHYCSIHDSFNIYIFRFVTHQHVCIDFKKYFYQFISRKILRNINKKTWLRILWNIWIKSIKYKDLRLIIENGYLGSN